MGFLLELRQCWQGRKTTPQHSYLYPYYKRVKRSPVFFFFLPKASKVMKLVRTFFLLCKINLSALCLGLLVDVNSFIFPGGVASQLRNLQGG